MLYNREEKQKCENSELTKEKLERIVKRLSYISEMLHRSETERNVYISKRKEKIEINAEVLAVIEIIEEIIRNEEKLWLKKIFLGIRRGLADRQIIRDNPIERTKYYMIKRAFIEKIYQCCIYKWMVEYDNILKS